MINDEVGVREKALELAIKCFSEIGDICNDFPITWKRTDAILYCAKKFERYMIGNASVAEEKLPTAK
jgi:hypothetical protein